MAEQRQISLNFDRAVGLFQRFIEHAHLAGWQPYLITKQAPIKTHHLGKLSQDVPALFSADAILEPGCHYPVNYIGRHSVPFGFEQQDSLPGSWPGEQWYVGWLAERVGDISGYAISVNRFHNAYDKDIGFSAVQLPAA